MRLVVLERGMGKTTGLIRASAVTEYPIVVNTQAEKNHINDMKNKMNLNIPEPLTIDELKKHLRTKHIDNVLVDEGYDLISKALDNYLGTHVVAVTLSPRR